jgi:hypothetical protein
MYFIFVSVNPLRAKWNSTRPLKPSLTLIFAQYSMKSWMSRAYQKQEEEKEDLIY